MKYYALDSNGYIKSQGLSPDFGDLIADDEEQFFTSNEGTQWRFVDGQWIDEKEGYKYFLIPSDLVPHIAHYAGFVKEALFHLAFNVKAASVGAVVEGEEVESPLYINHIPCSCTHWTEEGLMLLEAIIENWDTTYPNKPLREPYKFESYNELIAFRNANL